MLRSNFYFCSRSFVFILLLVTFQSCSKDEYITSTPVKIEKMRESPIRFTKWYRNHTAVISLTYDCGAHECIKDQKVQKLVRDYKIPLDYELVTATLSEKKKNYILNVMIPQEFQFFGHGHEHVNHDTLTFEAALHSFRFCYTEMVKLGLKPVAYAYPGGYGWQSETREALAIAGFLGGRLHHELLHKNPYIMPDNEAEPEDFYGLPCLVMQDIRAFNNDRAINNAPELIPFLDEAIDKKAWIITAFHSIGDTLGWGFFDLIEFENCLKSIKYRDFWAASMNDVILYIREKKDAKVTYEWINNSTRKAPELRLFLSDLLPNDIYDHPLTLLINVPDKWIGKPIGIFQNDSLVTETKFTSKNGMLSLKPNEVYYWIKPINN